ncbi:hypothetical protein PV326_012085 [Microctonus aethiopoides]|uniref:Uncharacterized protein n=1 Tax=Microctonus aethiopoides TaxID=144406 RepID=A0AA39FGS7_9HYME|nr:hypothetical protein PV326_012085 [Microctonus aethiopoides]KAK0169304.1 hypothetical protein PV328_012223 [Microctonus aethiopoides]
MICKGFRFTSVAYSRANKSNNSIFFTPNDKKGIITNICCHSINIDGESREKVIVFFREIQEFNEPFLANNSVKIEHIKEYSINQEELQTCEPADLMGHCLIFEINHENYVSKVLRGCLND